MALIPLNINLTTTWLDITDDIFNVFDNKYGVEFYLPYEHTKTLEILVDTTGIATMDENDNNTGTRLDRYFISTSTRLNVEYKYYARALDTIATISIKDKGNAVSIEGVDTFHGSINIHDACVHDIPVNELFHRHTGVATTLAIASLIEATSITITDITGFIVGTTFQIENGIIETTFPTVTSILGNVLTLDKPLDNAFAVGDKIEIVDTNMAVLGTLTNPVSFKLIPDKNQIWHIIRFLVGMTHSGAADDSKFGDIAKLTNGAVLRAYNAIENQYRTFTIWKNNEDIKMDMYDVNYTDKAGGGLYGTNARGSLKIGTGAAAKLNGKNGDYLELLIQDDLTALASFNLKGQGHIEGL